MKVKSKALVWVLVAMGTVVVGVVAFVAYGFHLLALEEEDIHRRAQQHHPANYRGDVVDVHIIDMAKPLPTPKIPVDQEALKEAIQETLSVLTAERGAYSRVTQDSLSYTERTEAVTIVSKNTKAYVDKRIAEWRAAQQQGSGGKANAPDPSPGNRAPAQTPRVSPGAAPDQTPLAHIGGSDPGLMGDGDYIGVSEPPLDDEQAAMLERVSDMLDDDPAPPQEAPVDPAVYFGNLFDGKIEYVAPSRQFYREVLSRDQQLVYDIMLTQVQKGVMAFTAKAKSLSDDEYMDVYYAIGFDHPELYYLSGYGYTAMTYEGEDYFGSTIGYDPDPGVSPDECIRRFNAAAKPLLEAGRKLKTDIEKVKLVHDRICLEVSYTKADDIPAVAGKMQTAYSAIVNRETVCAGYARALQFYLNALGVEASTVTSLNHGWNLVELDGEYYNMDVCWDDHAYLTLEGVAKQVVDYDWFNVTDAYARAQENPFHLRTELSARLPEAKGTKYNYYTYYNVPTPTPLDAYPIRTPYPDDTPSPVITPGPTDDPPLFTTSAPEQTPGGGTNGSRPEVMIPREGDFSDGTDPADLEFLRETGSMLLSDNAGVDVALFYTGKAVIEDGEHWFFVGEAGGVIYAVAFSDGIDSIGYIDLDGDCKMNFFMQLDIGDPYVVNEDDVFTVGKPPEVFAPNEKWRGTFRHEDGLTIDINPFTYSDAPGEGESEIYVSGYIGMTHVLDFKAVVEGDEASGEQDGNAFTLEFFEDSVFLTDVKGASGYPNGWYDKVPE